MPCTPPPGGVADEHRYTPSIGVVHGFSRGVGPARACHSVVAAHADVAADVVGVVLGHPRGGNAAGAQPRCRGSRARSARKLLSRPRSGRRASPTAHARRSTAADGPARRCGPGRRDAARRPAPSAIPRAVRRRPRARARHLLAGAAQVQRGRIGQSRIRPRDLARQHEVHLGHARTESVAPQRLCIPRR